MLYSNFTLEWTHCCASIDPVRRKKNEAMRQAKLMQPIQIYDVFSILQLQTVYQTGNRPDHKVRTRNKFDGTVLFFFFVLMQLSLMWQYFNYILLLSWNGWRLKMLTGHTSDNIGQDESEFSHKTCPFSWSFFFSTVFHHPIQSYLELLASLGRFGNSFVFSMNMFHFNEMGKILLNLFATNYLK